MRIGLFFGSFNPIHVGHLIIANTIANSDLVDKVWFVVTPQNPFKQQSGLAHEFDRYDMVRKAIFDNEKLEVSDVEFSLEKPSYTVDTLTHLSEKYKEINFSLIMGEDNLKTIHKWKKGDVILKYYPIIVYPRPGVEPQVQLQGTIHRVEAPQLQISASYIRRCIKNGTSIKYLVHPEVRDFIHSKGLYQ